MSDINRKEETNIGMGIWTTGGLPSNSSTFAIVYQDVE